MRTTFILGAGFSKNSGIPVQAEMPKKLIDNQENTFECAVTAVIKKFMKDVFGFDGTGEPPNLDDIITSIDLSINSGHHLGIAYSPAHLRTLRKLIVYRIFSILEGSFIWDKEVSLLISRLCGRLDEVGFVVLNWDTVLENYMFSAVPDAEPDYCNSSRNWRTGHVTYGTKTAKIAKVHGSCNWLYCGNCRSLFYDIHNDFSLKERAGFQSLDLTLFEELKELNCDGEVLSSKKCLLCGNGVSSHIATFSYRKSFRSNSFADIWKEAESMLSTSDNWVFIGYSLPDADYEFKHLLKIAEMKLAHIKQKSLSVDVVLLNSDSTASKYQKFFGNRLHHIYNGGIREYIKNV